jgi:hypothetical protein
MPSRSNSSRGGSAAEPAGAQVPPEVPARCIGLHDPRDYQGPGVYHLNDRWDSVCFFLHDAPQQGAPTVRESTKSTNQTWANDSRYRCDLWNVRAERGRFLGPKQSQRSSSFSVQPMSYFLRYRPSRRSWNNRPWPDASSCLLQNIGEQREITTGQAPDSPGGRSGMSNNGCMINYLLCTGGDAFGSCATRRLAAPWGGDPVLGQTSSLVCTLVLP